MNGGLATFRGNHVIMAAYDGFTRPSDEYKCMMKALASKFGEFIIEEPQYFHYTINFFRVRVRIDVCKPLKRVSPDGESFSLGIVPHEI